MFLTFIKTSGKYMYIHVKLSSFPRNGEPEALCATKLMDAVWRCRALE